MKLFARGHYHVLLPAKLLLIMRLTTAILLIGTLHLSAKGISQTVSFSGSNVPLVKVFAAVKEQTGYVFFYKLPDLQDAKPVTVNLKDTPLQEALEKILTGQPLQFSIQGNTVFITLKELQAAIPPANLPEALPPQGEIHGVITNAQGVPLAGANVIIKRTKRGVQTNAKGEFNLKNVYPDDVLMISFIGYTTQSIKVGSGKEFSLVLEIATNELDKVVVQAYGTTTQRLATGNISTVTAKEIERHPVMNTLEALYGKVPGMVISQTSGYASAPIKVEIRGRANINGLPSDPLFIIDGVPIALNGTGAGGGAGLSVMGLLGPANGQSPLFSLNPLDIETITVLKDADATAIYGSRGANGVVIITTKKGKPGKAKLELSVYEGISMITQRYKMLDEKQYLSMRIEALKNDKISADPGIDYDLLIWDTTRSIDWQKIFWGGKGKETDVQASYSGGDKFTTFRLSGGYHRQTSILNYSGADQRGSAQFNLNRRSLNERLRISFTSMYSYSQSNLIYGPAYVTMAPDAPDVFDLHGNLNYSGWAPISAAYPFANLLQPYIAKTSYLNSQLEGQYEIIKGLNLSANLGYSTSRLRQYAAQPIISQDPSSNPKGSAQFGYNDFAHWIVEPRLEYKQPLGKGKVEVLIAGTYQASNFNGMMASGIGYVNNNLLQSVANAPSKNVFDGYYHYRYLALSGRLNYNWDDKYILNLTARRDGSSRFGSGRQFGNFGAVGAAWIFTQENWLKDFLSFLSFGKLRGSYGLTGSDIINDYEFMTRWSAGNTLPYQGIPAYVALQHANPDLHWQTNKKLEFAIGLGFLKDRLTMEMNWYRNRCGDQLLTYRLPNTTGFSSVTANFPATVQNTGIEGKLEARLIQQKNIDWSVNMNFGANRNKLLAFPNIDQSPYASLYTVGKSLSIIRLLHYTGVDPQTGQYTFQDKNKDGQIDYGSGPTSDLYDKDMTIGLDGGFGTDLRYKGWQLNLFFNFRKQELPSAIFNGIPGQANTNQSTQALNHWQKPGDIANFARYTTNPAQSDFNFFASDGIYSDGSYVRLRNLSLSYDFPDRWTKKAGMQSCKIYFRGENLFIITKYNGVDPDVPGFGLLPLAKVLTAGIQFNF